MSTILTEQKASTAISPPANGLIWGVCDQAVFSGTSFMVSVLIGRFTDATTLGIYALGMSIIAIAISAQDAVISSSYVIHYRTLGAAERRQYAGSTLSQAIALAIVFGMALLIVANVTERLGLAGEGWMIHWGWSLSLLIPAAMLRQYGRKMAFAEKRYPLALMIDLLVTLIVAAGFYVLIKSGNLSAMNAYLVLSVACFTAVIYWWNKTWKDYHFERDYWLQDFRRTLSQGKWLLAGRIVAITQRYLALWLLGLYLDKQAMGIYAACVTLVSAANILLHGLGNALEPQVAAAYNQGGYSALIRIQKSIMLLFGVLMTLLWLVLLFFGSQLLLLIFNSQLYSNHAAVLIILGAAVLIESLSVGASQSLRIIMRAELNLRINFAAAVLTIGSAFFLIPRYGIYGAAASTLCGISLSSLLKVVVFNQCAREES